MDIEIVKMLLIVFDVVLSLVSHLISVEFLKLNIARY